MNKTSQFISYIALLRGINVGGNKKVPMVDLKKVFEDMGYTNVKTILNTGNVLFETENEVSTKMIEAVLEKTFGFPIPTIILAQNTISNIIASDPFKGINVTPQIRLYVTFLSEKPTSSLSIPYVSSDKSFTILKVTNEAIFSVLDLSKSGTIDAMKKLEKEFGSPRGEAGNKITTRNWNTVKRYLV